MLDTYKYKGRIKCPGCGKDAPAVGLCPACGCYTDCRTSPSTGDAAASANGQCETKEYSESKMEFAQKIFDYHISPESVGIE